MIRFLFACLLAVCWLQTVGQSQPTTLYFVNTSVMGRPFTLYTAPTPSEGIKVRSKTYQQVQFSADSLVLFIDKEPMPIRLGRGKTYFFVVNADASLAFDIQEVPDYRFWLAVSINRVRKADSFGVVLN